MKLFVRLVLLALILGVGVWLWSWLFPPPEKIIRARVMSVARCASFQSDEGIVARAAKMSELTDCFDRDVKIYLDADVPELGRLSLTGRDEISQAEMTARSKLSSLGVTFVGLKITVGADKETGMVDLTARVAARGDENFYVGELQFFFKKINKEWLITRVESVKVLR